MATKYSENMSAEEEKSLMAEIEYEDACYAGAAEFDAAHAVEGDPEEMEEACQDETLRKAALNRGAP